LVKYTDEDGIVKIGLLNPDAQLPSQTEKPCGCRKGKGNVVVDSSEDSNSYSAEQYAVRDGPNDSTDRRIKYNISVEDEDPESEVYNEQYSESSGESSDSDMEPETSQLSLSSQKNCTGNSRVFVYKQPKIVVKPKTSKFVVKHKPIVVRPPPIVIHQPPQKPCNPIIRYQPPKIKIRPVIVKIGKPKTRKTRTTTTMAPTTSTTTEAPTTPTTTTRRTKKTRKTRKPTKRCRIHRPKNCGCSDYYSQESYRPKFNLPPYFQYETLT
jgi:hypothetical protein